MLHLFKNKHLQNVVNMTNECDTSAEISTGSGFPGVANSSQIEWFLAFVNDAIATAGAALRGFFAVGESLFAGGGHTLTPYETGRGSNGPAK